MEQQSNNIELLDCTLRDGGYVNNWDFDEKLARETYRALSKSGVDIVELGYHGTEKYFDPSKYGLFRFCSLKTIEKITEGIDGAKASVMVDMGKFDLADLEQYKGSKVGLIRLAFHKNRINEAFGMIAGIKSLGFRVSANLMGYANYSEDEKRTASELILAHKPDYVYFADTYGSLFPDSVGAFFRSAQKVPGVALGFHPHNNLQMGFADSLAAVENGAKIVDSSIFGMGRGAGNLPTEIMVAYLQQLKPEKYNPVPLLNIIDKYFAELHQKFGWGYCLPYMVSGIKSCHPDYATHLIARREYDIEEIWNIIGIIKSLSPVGFDKQLLEKVLKKGFFGRVAGQPNGNAGTAGQKVRKPEVPYLKRHEGKDFLIIANGPSLARNIENIQKFIGRMHPVVMGCNYIGDKFKPDYHAFNNRRRFVEHIDSVDKEASLLLSEYFEESMVREYTLRPYEKLIYEDSSEAPFDIKDGVISANCRTIALLLAGVAAVMGAKRVFIAGLDGYMNLDSGAGIHFYDEKEEPEDREVLMDRHLGNLRYLKEIDQYLSDRGGEGVHILTPTDYKAFYKGFEHYL